jgi:hypothetical protein
MDTVKLYRIQAIPCKGQGLVAATKIAKGTRILSEEPLLTAPRHTDSMEKLHKSLVEKVAGLSDDQRQAFFSLHNAFVDEMAQELGIARTNALPLVSNASTRDVSAVPSLLDQAGIFVDASRINHACIQNAHHAWNDDLGQLTVHAIRDIDEGEEITIMYLDVRRKRTFRRRKLKQKFRFSCSCQMCCLPPTRRPQNDANLYEIQTLDKWVTDAEQVKYVLFQYLFLGVRKLLRLSQEEGLADVTVARTYDNACQIAIVKGDRARARVLAERASAAWTILEGNDSPAARRMRDLMTDPTKDPTYGCPSHWSTSTSDIPSRLSPEAFEAWLWTGENVDPQWQYADLRYDATFPSFEWLPEENDLEFYESPGEPSYKPRKHWCFLAEIADVNLFRRLMLLVEDKDGRETEVAFHTDDRGLGLNPLRVRKGHTVAILYANQHGFVDMSRGIRLDNADALTVSDPLVWQKTPLHRSLNTR